MAKSLHLRLGLVWCLAMLPQAVAAETDEAPAAAGPATPTYEVRTIQDVPYAEGPDADRVRHTLDLYLPKEAKDFPVILFVHGGAWTHGDKSTFGLYKALGTFWARHGIGMIMTNYRLSPSVMYPAHVKDVAKAFAWTRRNIAGYGGRADRLFVMGHSAGGHLAALLATDDAFLKAEGLDLRAIRGVVCVSGVYCIPESNFVFDAIFGADPEVRKAASPLTRVRGDAPPFLILYAERDLALCGKKPSEEFCRALQGKNVAARVLEVRDRSHVSVLLKARTESDPAVIATRQFIRDQIRETPTNGTARPVESGVGK